MALITNNTRENFVVPNGGAEAETIAPGETKNVSVDFENVQFKGAQLAGAITVGEPRTRTRKTKETSSTEG